MADEKTVTEREAVLRERAAFTRGIACERTRLPFAETTEWVAERDSLYPLPVQKRPLRARFGETFTVWYEGRGAGWTVLSGGLVAPHQSLGTAVQMCRTPEDLRRIADCLSGAMEDVPEGEE